MSTIVTRGSKGSSLSWAEMDANLNNLNADKAEVSSLGTAATKDVGTTTGTVAAGDHNHSGIYQPASANLDEYAAVNPTTQGLALLDDATAADQRTTMGARGEADDVILAAGKKIIFEGTTDDAYELTLDPGDPTADRTLQLALLANNKINDFRLTLTSGLPVTISDVTAASTIYCTPKTGNLIALYDGSNWNLRQSAEFSKALSGLTNGKPYDVFCYDNAGTPTLEFLVWTDDTTRATNLTRQDGVLVKSGDATRRYLGSFYTTSTTTTEDSMAKRYLWNYYHRAHRKLRLRSSGSWTYTTNTLRQANADTANQVEVMLGVAEDAVDLHLIGEFQNSTASVLVNIAIGVDNTTTRSTDSNGGYGESYAANDYVDINAHYCSTPSAGRHYFTWLEASTATGTTTWWGATSGFNGSCKA